jgi:hypothetical protein
MTPADIARFTHGALVAYNALGPRGANQLLATLNGDDLRAVALLAIGRFHDELVLGCAEAGLDFGDYLRNIGLQLARETPT